MHRYLLDNQLLLPFHESSVNCLPPKNGKFHNAAQFLFKEHYGQLLTLSLSVIGGCWDCQPYFYCGLRETNKNYEPVTAAHTNQLRS